MATWYLSFADETGFLGACLVDASDLPAALTASWLLGCNPGGEVQMSEIPEEGMSATVHVWFDALPRGVLMNREQAESLAPPDE